MPPSENEQEPAELFERLKGTPTEDVLKGVKSVEKFTEEEAEGHSRWVNARNKTVKASLFSRFLGFLFYLVCTVVSLVTAAALWLTWLWVTSFTDDPERFGAFLSDVWQIVLVALATLFVQSIFPKD